MIHQLLAAAGSAAAAFLQAPAPAPVESRTWLIPPVAATSTPG
jgi:hypothetical protein